MLKHLLPRLGRNVTNLVIAHPKLTRAVEQRVDVQRRCLGFARQLAEFVHEFLLQLAGEVILGAEKDDATLRDLCFGYIVSGEEPRKFFF